MEMGFRYAGSHHVSHCSPGGSGSRDVVGSAPATTSHLRACVYWHGAPGTPVNGQFGSNRLSDLGGPVSLRGYGDLGVVVPLGHHSVQLEHMALEARGGWAWASTKLRWPPSVKVLPMFPVCRVTQNGDGNEY